MPKPEARTRVGLIGCGAWGWNYLHVLRESHRFELVGACDNDVSLCRRVEREYGIKTMASTELMQKCEAVVIAAPTAQHVPMAVSAMAIGCHVLIEKPAARTTAEVDSLDAASFQYGKRYMAGHLMLYHEAIQQAIGQAKSGGWGDPLLFRSTRWGTGRKRDGETPLESLASHDLAMIHALFSADEPLSGMCHPDGHGWISGPRVSVDVSWAHARKVRTVDIHCEDAILTVDDMVTHGGFQVYDRKGNGTSFPPVGHEEPLGKQCRAFADMIQGGVEPPSGPKSVRAVARWLEGFRKGERHAGDDARGVAGSVEVRDGTKAAKAGKRPRA